MSQIAIRAISRQDYPELCTLWRETFLQTYTGHLPPDILAAMLAEFAGNDAAAMLPGRDETGLCAVTGNKIIASMVFAGRGPVVYMWAAYVLPQFQRLGAGSRLLRACAGHASQTAVMEIRVVPGLASADGFYARHGFAKAGDEQMELAPGHFVAGIVLRQSIAALRALSPVTISRSGESG